MEPKEKRPRGRPPHVPTDRDRRQVEIMTGLGLTQEQIGKILGVSEDTLQRHYADEIANGVAKANVQVAQNLFNIATSREQGSVAAAIFWMKSRGKWKEVNHVAHGGDDERAPIKIDANLKGLSDAELDQMQNLLGKASGKTE